MHLITNRPLGKGCSKLGLLLLFFFALIFWGKLLQ